MGAKAGQRRVAAPRGNPDQLGLMGMPEPLFVCTPSKLLSYEDCPRKYRYSYVDRPMPQKGPPWAHNSLGASVHTALKNWYAVPPEKRTPEILPTLLHATWVREGYRDDAQEKLAFQRALEWLESYTANLDPADDPVGVERTVATRTEILALSGRVDRLDQRGNELAIVDYKTGRTESSSDDARGSLALALYAIAASRTIRRPCWRVELHHLPSGTTATHDHTEESLTRQLGRAEATAKDIKVAIQAEEFPTNPGPGCRWCDFRAVCPDGTTVTPAQPWEALSHL